MARLVGPPLDVAAGNQPHQPPPLRPPYSLAALLFLLSRSFIPSQL